MSAPEGDRVHSAEGRLRGSSIVPRQLAVVAFCLLSFARPVLAGEPPGFSCSPEAVAAFSAATAIKEFRRVDGIPPEVRKAFGSIDRMADAGAGWDSGCVDDGTNPRSQLLFAAGAGPVWMLHYRAGGFAALTHLMFVCFGSNGAYRYFFAARCAPGWSPEIRDAPALEKALTFQSVKDVQKALKPECLQMQN